jgi:AraC-like DNA-binding protein
LLLLERFLLHFLEKMKPGEIAISLKDDEINRLIKVEAMLVRDFSQAPPTITELSKISAMSPTKLKKDFKFMYGLPIYEYYQKNRMMRAKALLQEEKYAIKQVGTMVGYTNLGHFASSFKKEFGILPSEVFNTGKGQA